MVTLIMPNELTLKEAIGYMKKLSYKGYSSWFKSVVNKNTKTFEVHLIMEDKFITIVQDGKV